MTRLDTDILIIGSGAAGGVLAATLSELTTRRITLVEKGGYFAHEFFNQREWDMRVLYAEEGNRTTADGWIPVRGGQCVGGGTTVNIALSFDPVRQVWDRWRQNFDLTGFSFDQESNDYGVEGLNMASCTREVRRRINVHTPDPQEVNENNRLFEAGCRSVGITTRFFELNVKDCLGCGYCAEGCAYDRKQGTMITYLADALSRGVRLVHHCEVETIEFAKRRETLIAVGARARVSPTRKGSRPNTVPAGDLHISSRLVLLCAGAIETPIVLMRSGHPDPYGVLGTGLILHPSLPIIGVMERPITNYRGISGTIYSDHFYRSHGFYYECLFGHPVYGSVVLPGFGASHFEQMLAFQRTAGFGVMLIDSSDPRNRVEWNRVRARTAIRYQLAGSDKARLRFAARAGVEIMLAAGAREAFLPSEERLGPRGVPRFRSAGEAAACDQLQFAPHQTTITSAHAQATLKMSEDPRRAALNPRGESHIVRNLLVCDSSAFPTSCGANPMVSILTMARYQGRRIAGELGRYDL
jgi:choline dehydrogenase-like flavoprotein